MQSWGWRPGAGRTACHICPGTSSSHATLTPGFPGHAIALVALVLITTVGPVLSSIDTRAHLGITLEQDGLVQTEAAVDRLMHGQAIYGVDWSNTALA